MIKGVEHVGIKVKNMDESIQFYTDVLRLTLQRRMNVNADVEIAFLRHPSETSLEVELIKENKVEGDGTVDHIAFRVDSIKDVINYLQLKNTNIEGNVRQLKNGTKIVFFRGPNNEKLELVERSIQQ